MPDHHEEAFFAKKSVMLDVCPPFCLVGDDPPFLGDALPSRGFFTGLPCAFFTESSSADALRLPTGVVGGNSEENWDFPGDFD